MGNQWGLGHFIFVTIFLVATMNTCLGARNTTVACFEHERLALLKFKHSVTDDYDILSSWVGSDCCHWKRVTCDGVAGNVDTLQLRGDSNAYLVSKELGTSLGELRHLKYLDLSMNIFQGSIPEFVRSLKQLTYLNLSHASFSGPLPAWLRKKPIIPYIDLSHNNLSGPLTNLPSGDANMDDDSKFVRPRLFLQNNIFSESIPRSLCKRTDLVYLDLSRNRLIGKIPECFKNLQELFFLKLNSNELRGIIPSFIGHISSLRVLTLNDNNLRGELPVDLWNLTYLEVLDLGDNALSGKIPEWIGEKVKSLVVFRLHKNNFTGRIPSSLCKNTKLQILDVAHNNFTGTIPRCLEELQAMRKSTSHIDYGEGTEMELAQVIKGSSLEYTKTWYFINNMDLSSNKLVGEIPIEVTALRALVGLNLSNNHLTGHIPDNIGNIKALSSLDLSGNELSGLIPPSIASLNFLSHLNLSNNNLFGRIPIGTQLQTLFDPSIYAGNKDLCGTPLPKKCSG